MKYDRYEEDVLICCQKCLQKIVPGDIHICPYAHEDRGRGMALALVITATGAFWLTAGVLIGWAIWS